MCVNSSLCIMLTNGFSLGKNEYMYKYIDTKIDLRLEYLNKLPKLEFCAFEYTSKLDTSKESTLILAKKIHLVFLIDKTLTYVSCK